MIQLELPVEVRLRWLSLVWLVVGWTTWTESQDGKSFSTIRTFRWKLVFWHFDRDNQPHSALSLFLDLHWIHMRIKTKDLGITKTNIMWFKNWYSISVCKNKLQNMFCTKKNLKKFVRLLMIWQIRNGCNDYVKSSVY